MILRSDTTVADALNTPSPGIYVTVKDVAGNLAAIYSDDGVTVKANPFTSGLDGTFSYYAAEGAYTEEYRRTLGGQPTQVVAVELKVDNVIRTDLAASTGATLVGSTGPSTVQADITARPTSAALAASGGAALVGYAIDTAGYPSGTAGKAIDRLRNTGLLLSEEYATLNDFFAAVEGMSGKKGGIISPGTWNVASAIDRSAVDWSGVTIMGLPGLSKINSTGSYGVLKLGNIDRVLIDGVGFTSSYVNAVEDTGAALLYSYQKSVLNSVLRRLYFSNPTSFTSALTFYARVNAADTSGRIDGLMVEQSLFENVGRICMTLMNRFNGADANTFMRNVRIVDNIVRRAGAAAPTPAVDTNSPSLSGMFISMDGYSEDYVIARNNIEAAQGLGIELAGNHRSGLVEDNVFRDFTHGLHIISVDPGAGPGAANVTIARNRMEGPTTGALHAVLYGLDETCVLEDNDFLSENSQEAAVFVDSTGVKSRRNLYRNDNPAGIYGVYCGGATTIDSDGDTFDDSASGAQFAVLRFDGASATGSTVKNAKILKGTGGSVFDQINGAANNAISPYTTAAGLQGEYLSLGIPDADTTVSATSAMTAFYGCRITGALTAQRTVNFPSRLAMPKAIWNSTNFPLLIQVAGVNASVIYPNCKGPLVYDAALGSARFFGPDKAFLGIYANIAALPSAPGAGKGTTAYLNSARNTGEGAGAGTGSLIVSDGTIWRIPGAVGAVTE